ncbi:ankyrin [Choiromyces venosus 120613-1]|uniref:Ankyrin n=1 Tax=Choiromyces venosus 120613-1 TaxID=1336337 RepID=A0A3N4JG66_9PEZI|nr:ankyrin [Choiromyces venosus 120613-1]
MSFLNLPNELVLKISEELNPPDVCSLLKASHRLAILLYFPLVDSVCRRGSKSYATKALHSAARVRNKQVVQNLLDRGILENVQNGDTLLNYAVERHSEAVVQTLLECGVNAETRDRYGRTPLTNAVDCGYEEMVQLLIDHGADVNSKDNSEITPLLIAAFGGHDEVARILLRADDIDVNAQDRFCETAIHYAVEGGHKDVVQLLLAQKDVNIDLVDYTGHSVRSLIGACAPRICEMLTEYVSSNNGVVTEFVYSSE